MRWSICDRPSTSKGKRNQLKHAQECKDNFLIPVYHEYVHIIKQSANNNNPTHICLGIFLCTKTAGQKQRLIKHNEDSEGKPPKTKQQNRKIQTNRTNLCYKDSASEVFFRLIIILLCIRCCWGCSLKPLSYPSSENFQATRTQNCKWRNEELMMDRWKSWWLGCDCGAAVSIILIRLLMRRDRPLASFPLWL